MFDDRRTWIDHEMQNHRRSLACQLCGTDAHTSEISLSTHMTEKHGPLEPDQVVALVMISSRPKEVSALQECVLCDWTATAELLDQANGTCHNLTISTRRLMNHIARHLEQLALFALPRHYGFHNGTNNSGLAVQMTDASVLGRLGASLAMIYVHRRCGKLAMNKTG